LGLYSDFTSPEQITLNKLERVGTKLYATNTSVSAPSLLEVPEVDLVSSSLYANNLEDINILRMESNSRISAPSIKTIDTVVVKDIHAEAVDLPSLTTVGVLRRSGITDAFDKFKDRIDILYDAERVAYNYIANYIRYPAMSFVNFEALEEIVAIYNRVGR